jgi:hypothetical protein
MTRLEATTMAIAVPFIGIVIVSTAVFMYSHKISSAFTPVAQESENITTPVQKHFDICHFLNAQIMAKQLPPGQSKQIKSINDCYDDDRDDPLYGDWITEAQK